LNFNTEFKDFMANNAYEIAPMLASLAGILSSTTLNPDSIDAAFDVDARPDYTPPGIDYISKLITPAHPLAKTIFPTQENVKGIEKSIKEENDFSGSLHEGICREDDDGTATFNTMMFALGFGAMNKNINLVYQSLNTINDAFVKNHDELQLEKNMHKMVDWFHVTGNTSLSNIYVQRTGTLVDNYAEEYDFLGFEQSRISEYAKQKVTQKSLTPSPLTSADKHEISAVKRAGEPLPTELDTKYRNKPIDLLYKAANDNQTNSPNKTPEQGLSAMQKDLQGKTLRQFTPADVLNNTGASITDKAAGNALYEEIRTGELGKKLNQPLYVVDKDSEQFLRNITGRGTKALAVLLLGMSVVNLVMVRGAVAEQSTKIRKFSALLELLFYTAYAVEVVCIKFKGLENVRLLYHVFENINPEKDEDWVVAIQNYIDDMSHGVRLTPIALMGVGANLISLVFNISDLLHSIHEHNTGESIADILDISADVLEILAILAEYAAKDSTAYFFLESLGPLGWIASLVSFVAFIVAYNCEETPLQHWTKHCPLSLVLPEKNMTEYESCTSLLSILQTPNASISILNPEEKTGYQSIEVYIKLPCFKIGDVSLQVETTWERENETSQVVTAANSVMIVKNIEHAKQTLITPASIKQCCDAQGRVVAMRYIYNDIPVKITHEHEGFISIDTKINYRTRVRLYSQKHKYSLPYVPGTKKLPKESREIKGLRIDTTLPGWYYVEVSSH
jgi:hypothetical protein